MGSHNSRRTFGRSSRASLVKVRKSARVERGGGIDAMMGMVIEANMVMND